MLVIEFMNTFRVLILDDSRELIQKLGSRVKHQHTLAGTDWQVLFHEIHVQVEKANGVPRFSDETLRAIIEACRNKPNLVLADYGFIAPEDSQSPPDAYFNNALTPASLIPAIRDYLNRKHRLDKVLIKQVEETFINNPCPFYLYTYTGKSFQGASPIPDDRARLTQRAFAQSRVHLVDISREIYENDAYSGDNKLFRAYLTAGLLAQIIERELLLFVIGHENERLRYVRFKRSGMGVAVIVLLGSGIGYVGEWIGSNMMRLVHNGFETSALAIGVLAGLSFFALGLFIPALFERFLTHLLSKRDSD